MRMENGGFIPFDQFPMPRIICPCCGVMRMPTEEELEQRITEQIDRERLEAAILDVIENKKAVTIGENIPRLSERAGQD